MSVAVIRLKDLSDAINKIVMEIEGEVTPKIKSIIINTILISGEKEQEKWVKGIQKALSDPIPSYMLHKKRMPRNRLFPYLVSGELKDSVKTDLHLLRKTKNTATFRWWFGLISPHATYTTNSYKSKDNPGWKNWTERAFTSSLSPDIPSASGLIAMFFTNRLKQILKGV